MLVLIKILEANQKTPPRKQNAKEIHISNSTRENSSPNGKGLGFTEEAAGPEADKALPTPLEALVCFPAHPHENKGSAQGPARKVPEEATGAVCMSHLLTAHSKKHRRKSCSSSLISNCGCMAAVCCVEEVLPSPIQSLQFIFSQDSQLGWLVHS